MKLKDYLTIELDTYVDYLPADKTLVDAVNLFIDGQAKSGWNSRNAKAFALNFEEYVPGIRYYTWFLLDRGLKYCFKCENVLNLKDFGVDKYKALGKKCSCKTCSNTSNRKYFKDNPELSAEKSATRRARKLVRTPPWFDKSKMQEVYNNCPEGMVRDHIIPLKGSIVSGLHIPENIQYLTPKENGEKCNKFEVITIYGDPNIYWDQRHAR